MESYIQIELSLLVDLRLRSLSSLKRESVLVLESYQKASSKKKIMKQGLFQGLYLADVLQLMDFAILVDFIIK